jgi:hypothetical protein
MINNKFIPTLNDPLGPTAENTSEVLFILICKKTFLLFFNHIMNTQKEIVPMTNKIGIEACRLLGCSTV